LAAAVDDGCNVNREAEKQIGRQRRPKGFDMWFTTFSETHGTATGLRVALGGRALHEELWRRGIALKQVAAEPRRRNGSGVLSEARAEVRVTQPRMVGVHEALGGKPLSTLAIALLSLVLVVAVAAVGRRYAGGLRLRQLHPREAEAGAVPTPSTSHRRTPVAKPPRHAIADRGGPWQDPTPRHEAWLHDPMPSRETATSVRRASRRLAPANP
jgi:hypothetical protein